MRSLAGSNPRRAPPSGSHGSQIKKAIKPRATSGSQCSTPASQGQRKPSTPRACSTEDENERIEDENKKRAAFVSAITVFRVTGRPRGDVYEPIIRGAHPASRADAHS